MTRILGVLLVAGLIVASVLMRPEAAPLEDVTAPVPTPPAVAVCPVLQDRETTGIVTVSARVPGTVAATGFAAGQILTHERHAIDATGGGRIPFSDIAVTGLAGVLLEVPDLDTGAGMSVIGSGLAVGNCTAPASTTTIAAGVSTRGGEQVDLVLANPYAVDAVVTVASSSEAGVDSASELETVVVPASSVVTRALHELLPLRNRISVFITAGTGRVHGFLFQHGGDDRALVEAVTPGASWYLPLGAGDPDELETVVVATTSPSDLAVRVDGLIDGAWVEGIWEGTVPARAQVEMDLAELDPRPEALRVGAGGLIVPVLVTESDLHRAAAPGVPLAGTDWFVPGAVEGQIEMRIALVSDLDATVTIFPHQQGRGPTTIQVAAGHGATVTLPATTAGYAVRSTGDVVVMWQAIGDEGVALGAGVPVVEVGE